VQLRGSPILKLQKYRAVDELSLNGSLLAGVFSFDDSSGFKFWHWSLPTGEDHGLARPTVTLFGPKT